MKITGVIFIVVAAGSVGCQMASMLRKRCELIRRLLTALQLLKNEIVVCGTPLPQAFALLAASSEGILERVFSHAAMEMEKNRWVSPYDAIKPALESAAEPQLEAVLFPLAKQLGKYDVEAQLRGIEAAKVSAEQILQDLEQERKIKSKTYRTLGVCAGLAVAILLI